jgi:hypothetical protein
MKLIFNLKKIIKNSYKITTTISITIHSVTNRILLCKINIVILTKLLISNNNLKSTTHLIIMSTFKITKKGQDSKSVTNLSQIIKVKYNSNNQKKIMLKFRIDTLLILYTEK